MPAKACVPLCRSRRFLWGALAGLICLLTFGDAAVAAPATPRPNILLILADDLGFSDLGCYGSEIETPNLDRLAAQGLRYTQFYNTARCWPSRASLLTGYYAQQVRRDTVPGIKSGTGGVRPAWAPLVTEFLRPAGYRTYHSGKWHIDGKALDNGFDRSYQIAGSEHNYFSAKGNTEEGEPAQQTTNLYITTVVADHAIKCLREHAAKFGERPFFQYVAFTAPHFPLQAPAADIAKYVGKYRAGWNAMQNARYSRLLKLGIVKSELPAMELEVGPPYHFPAAFEKLGPDEVNRPLPWERLTDSQREFQAAKMAVHAAMVDRMDREIGRVLEQVRQMGVFENTIVLFASDNGASAEIMVRGEGHDRSAPAGSRSTFLCLGPGWSSACNTPFRRHKTWVHEGGISTPLIVHWPAGIRAKGELRTAPGHFIDIVPTILDLTGVEKPAQIKGSAVPAAPGRSLVPTFAADIPLEREYLWWSHENNRAVRAGNWKLVAAAGQPWELYNLATDRGESHNLAEREKNRATELEALWAKQDDTARRLLKEP